MKYQTCLFFKGKGCTSKVVKAKSIESAIERFMSGESDSRAEYGYAHPLKQSKPKADDWRWDIRCSVTGVVTMSNKRPGKNPEKELANQKKVALQTQ